MIDPSSAGTEHQENILTSMVVLKEEIARMESTLQTLNLSVEMTRHMSESFLLLKNQIALMETESRYYFELCNCKHLMMLDYMSHIKKLEEDLAAERPQKQ